MKNQAEVVGHGASFARRCYKTVAAVLAALLAVGIVVGADTAGAVSSAPHNRKVVSEQPASWTPHVLDGYVRTFAEVGSLTITGGNFSAVRTAANPTSIPRSNLFAVQTGSGSITSFAPNLNGEIYSIIPTGDGQTAWIAGGFSSLNGETIRSVAKIDVITGQRVAQFNPPSFNGRIHDMSLRNGKLYVMGRFTSAGAETRTALAALDPLTGALDPTVDVTFSDPRRDGALSILSADITPDGSTLVAIGNFTKINGQDRYQIGTLDLTTNPVSVKNWQTNAYGDGCSNSFQSYMRDVEISPDGSYFVVVTTGAYRTWPLCDTAARWDLDRTGTNIMPEWINWTGGDTLLSVAVTDGAVYLGGHQRWANNPYAGDRVGPGAVSREGISAVDGKSGATLSWNPGRTRGVGVYGMQVTANGLWIGSDTDRISGWQYRGRMAFMPLNGGYDLPADWAGELPGQVVSLGLQQGGLGSQLDRTTTRQFTGTNVTSSQTSAGTETWRDLRGAFMIDGKLYTGWSDSTFRVQDFDGSSFGPQETIPLALIPDNSTSLNRFASQDLSGINGMFYDSVTGRMYFTKSGSSRLHHRSFSSESRIVGAQRLESADNAGGINWANVRSTFLANGKLYLSDTNGNLHRADWNSKNGLPVPGTVVMVSGPSTGDGQDWRARDAFVFAAADFEPPNAPPVAAASAECAGAVCELSGAASADPDGTIVSYAWDFGDGTAPGTGEVANHVYAASGTYTVTLTVTDNRGATDTTQIQVAVTVPNLAPTANFTSSCTGLECSFDGSGSVDPDGSIVSYEWDFGDGSDATGATTSRTFAGAGTYTVTLTVTDNDGATAASSGQISVAPPAASTVEFRAAASSNANAMTPSVVVPGSVQAGDLMVLFATVNSSTSLLTGPAGWTLLDGGANGTATAQTYAWSRVATGADADSTVSLTNSVFAKTSLDLVAYSNAAAVSAHAFAFDTNLTNQFTTPTVSVTAPGSTLVSYWADKSSDNDVINVPGSVAQRTETNGVGGGRITSASADNGSLAPGVAGGVTASSANANRRSMTWSVVLAPAS